MVVAPHIVGTAAPVGMQATEWRNIAEHTRLIVSFGGMAPKNLQISFGGTGPHRARGWIERLGAAGIEAVSITPLRDDTVAALKARWLPVRPNADTALMLGLAHSLMAEDLHDCAFLDRYCTGFERFAAYLDGSADGVAKDADWAAARSDIAAEDIRALARRMAATRTMITLSYSLQRADRGEQPIWMGIALAAMLGQIGLPGGGFGIGYGAMGLIGSEKIAAGPRGLPTGKDPTGSFIPVARIADMLLNPGGAYDFNGQRRTYPDIRMVWWAGGNPFHHHQDLNRLLRAWRKPETVVVQDPFWTPAARHADIVLPAATALERNDLGAGTRDSTIYAMRRAVEPMGEARSDYGIVAALAERLGLGGAFTDGKDELDWIRESYEAFAARMAQEGAALPGFEDFWQDGRVRVAEPEDDFVLFADFRADPEANPLKTPSGRIEIFSETVAGFGYDDCPGHPVWIEPREWLGAPLAARFPLHLVSNQPATRLHSQLDPSPVSRAAKVAGREAVTIHPDDARAERHRRRRRGQALQRPRPVPRRRARQRRNPPGRRRAADGRLVRPGRTGRDRRPRPPRQPQRADPRFRHLAPEPGHGGALGAGRGRALGGGGAGGGGAQAAGDGGGVGRPSRHGHGCHPGRSVFTARDRDPRLAHRPPLLLGKTSPPDFRVQPRLFSVRVWDKIAQRRLYSLGKTRMAADTDARHLPLTVQTAYTDLLARLQEDAVLELGGTPVLRERGARGYWYAVQRLAGLSVERYLGPDSPEVRERVERARQTNKDAKQRARQRARLARMCRAARLPAADAQTGKVLSALSKAGIFRLRGVLVGTHAFRCYPALLGVEIPEARAATEDIDVAAYRSVSVALDDRLDPSLGDALSRIGPFVARPSLDREPTAWRDAESGALVELLTPNEGPDRDEPAQTLRSRLSPNR